MFIDTTVTIYIEGVEFDVLATFDCDYEQPERDVGFHGGWNVELYTLQLGDLVLNRDQVRLMIGAPELDRIEGNGAEAAMAEAA